MVQPQFSQSQPPRDSLASGLSRRLGTQGTVVRESPSCPLGQSVSLDPQPPSPQGISSRRENMYKSMETSEKNKPFFEAEVSFRLVGLGREERKDRQDRANC